jgi:peptidyl-prolyl cis-trans isomerase SurA
MVNAQPSGDVIDQVIGIIGNKIILQSDLEAQYQQYLAQGNYAEDESRCEVLDQLLLTKLLIHYANIDSVTVSDGQVEGEIEKRIAYFTEQFGGSTEKLEEYYQKSIPEIKDEFKPLIKEQLLAQTMQQKIIGKASASPADVKAYFNSIPKDSLPYINSEIEYGEIAFRIAISQAEKNRVRERLDGIRNRLLKGEDFATLAILYSQDAGSAKNGGELGFVPRGQFVPEFEAVAYRLKKGEISPIVETKFGFHVLQLIDRRGETINVRHILLKPEVSNEDLLTTKAKADSVAFKIREGQLSFDEAAQKFSDADDTKNNGGNVVNPQTGTTRFEANQIDAMVFFQIDKLKEGEISNPSLITSRDGAQFYKIFLLKKRTKPHVANLTDDYQRIQQAALNHKQAKLMDEWIVRKKKATYIRIDPEFRSCKQMEKWIN